MLIFIPLVLTAFVEIPVVKKGLECLLIGRQANLNADATLQLHGLH